MRAFASLLPRVRALEDETKQSGVLTIEGGDYNGTVTSPTATTLSIKGGTGQLVDRTAVLSGTTTITPISWTAQSNVDIGPLLVPLGSPANGSFVVCIDASGVLVLVDSGGSVKLNNLQFTQYIQLGSITLVGGNIQTFSSGTNPAYGNGEKLNVLLNNAGVQNDASRLLVIAPSAASPTQLRMQINDGSAVSSTAGIVFNQELPPTVTHTAVLDPAPLVALAFATGAFSFSATAEIDAANYESAPGILSSHNPNRYGLHRLFIAPQLRIVAAIYPQSSVGTLTEAAALSSTTRPPSLVALNTFFHAADLAIGGDETDFTDALEFDFIEIPV